VTTAHGTYLPEVEADAGRSVTRLLRIAGGRLTLRIDRGAFGSSAAIVAASRYQEREMVELYRVPPEKIEVIHNGVDLDLYSPAGARADLVASGAAKGGPTILFVGRLVPKKGLQHLIAAFPRILEAAPEARCVVVGGSKVFDTFGSELRRLSRRHGVADRFSWLQDVPELDMPGIYRAADLAVFPSVGYESLPTVVLEAMACGVPVVATRNWGTPEALGLDHPGLLEEATPEALAERVAAFLNGPELAARVRLDQLARVQPFALTASVAKHEELYRRVAPGR
jgi:spore coat protein SA